MSIKKSRFSEGGMTGANGTRFAHRQALDAARRAIIRLPMMMSLSAAEAS
jgi:hypothetical protein